MIKSPTIMAHLRDILILPFMVTVIVPFYLIDPSKRFQMDPLLANAIGFFAGVIGLTLFISSLLLFHRIGKGTLAPWSSKQRLIVIGPYRYTRNPMITGVLLILLSESFMLRSTSILWWALIFFIINCLYFLLFEEPDLERSFGNEYLRYKSNVPRWFPRIRPYHDDMTESATNK